MGRAARQNVFHFAGAMRNLLAGVSWVVMGKERLKRFGKVDIPAEALAVMLKRD